MKRLLPLLLALPVLAAEPGPLAKAYAGRSGALKVRLVASSLLERDPWSKGEWAAFSTQEVEWGFRLSYTTAKGPKPVLEAVLEDFRGKWTQRVQDDPKAPALDCAFVPPAEEKASESWAKALQGFSGTRLRIELDPQGGVLKVSGMTAASAKPFGPLLQDRTAKPLAREVQAWFTDETWKSLLGAAFLPAGDGKAVWVWPLPWPAEFEEKPLPAVPLILKVSSSGGEARVEGSVDAGKVDEDLQFPLQPGYHSLGTEQKGKLSAAYGPEGLKAASVEAGAVDRWDNYRPNSKADRFTRTASLKFTLEAAP